jgi:hypothetical protein
VSLSSFRGGPTFPALFIGAVGGIALSRLPGLPLVDGVAMGIGAMSVVMLRLPLTSVLLSTLLLASDGLAVMPLVIVAVVVAYVASARLTPAPATAAHDGNTAAHDGSPRPLNHPATRRTESWSKARDSVPKASAPGSPLAGEAPGALLRESGVCSALLAVPGADLIVIVVLLVVASWPASASARGARP